MTTLNSNDGKTPPAELAPGGRSALFVFCDDPSKDRVAPAVLDAVMRITAPNKSDLTLDGRAVFVHRDAKGNVFYFAPTAEVLSHNYRRYLPDLNRYFGNVDIVGLVNWHEGGSPPPNPIFCAHSTADVPTGNFGKSDPALLRSLLLAIEANRQKEPELQGFATWTEASHWSGVVYHQPPELIAQYAPPMVDIEIGSTPTAWSNRSAAEVLSRSLTQVFDRPIDSVRSLLCVGGVHFEPAFRAAIFDVQLDVPLAVSHILPNQWLVSGRYDDDDENTLAKYQSCVDSVVGGVDGICYHDNLKGTYKAILRVMASRLGIPMFSHKKLRQPDQLPFKSPNDLFVRP
jgi:hypothetical protein